MASECRSRQRSAIFVFIWQTISETLTNNVIILFIWRTIRETLPNPVEILQLLADSQIMRLFSRFKCDFLLVLLYNRMQERGCCK